LTALQVKNAKPDDKLADGGGLRRAPGGRETITAKPLLKIPSNLSD
jgi:hypothetical protein